MLREQGLGASFGHMSTHSSPSSLPGRQTQAASSASVSLIPSFAGWCVLTFFSWSCVPCSLIKSLEFETMEANLTHCTDRETEAEEETGT